MKKIKILFLITRCPKSGPIEVLNNIVGNLDKDKFSLFLISIFPENKENSILEHFKKDFSYEYIPMSKIDILLGRDAKLNCAIKKINPDVIHTTGVFADYEISKRYSARQLIIAHNYVNEDYPMLYGKVIGKFLSALQLKAMKKSAVTIACSESLSNIYEKEEKLKIPFIRNGVFCEKHENNSITKLEYRNKYHIPEDKIVLIYAANFVKRKNHQYLLECFKDYLQQHQNCYLLLLGDGVLFNELKALYSTEENISFRGKVFDVENYYKASDIYVSASVSEGMPMGVLEAMSYNLPVLLSDIVQHREVFSFNTEIGELFSLDNIKDFSHKLTKITKDDLSKKGNIAHQIVYENFNSENMSLQYEAFYRKVADRQSNNLQK